MEINSYRWPQITPSGVITFDIMHSLCIKKDIDKQTFKNKHTDQYSKRLDHCMSLKLARDY